MYGPREVLYPHQVKAIKERSKGKALNRQAFIDTVFKNDVRIYLAPLFLLFESDHDACRRSNRERGISAKHRHRWRTGAGRTRRCEGLI